MDFSNNRIQLFCIILSLFFTSGYCATCYSCEGQECLRTSKVTTTKECTVSTDTCATIFDKYSPVKKGCYRDLTEAEKLKCDTPDDISCYTCTTNLCNNLGRVDHKCKVCMGNSTDSACLNDLPSVPDQRCTVPRTKDAYCAVAVSGGIMARGCLSSYREIKDCLNNPAVCSMCLVNAEGTCNSQVFPANRRRCLYCSSTSGNDCTTDSSTSKLCPNPIDQCTVLNNAGVVKRSCTQDVTTEEKEFCTKNPTSCATCDVNNCNLSSPPAPPNHAGLKSMGNIYILSFSFVFLIIQFSKKNI